MPHVNAVVPYRSNRLLHHVHRAGISRGFHAVRAVKDGGEVPGENLRHAGQEGPGKEARSRFYVYQGALHTKCILYMAVGSVL